MKKVKEFVIVFCQTGSEGGYVVDHERTRPPYGYHHILRVYSDGSYWLVATVTSSVSHKTTRKIAKALASGLKVEVEADFYKKYTE